MEKDNNQNPLVSVVIPTYNYGHVVCDAVDSALEQTYHPMEILVIDDGSTDDTAAAVKKYGDKIRYIHQNNKGLSAARNTGIKQTKGEYIAFLDADDMWMPQKIEKQMKVFLENDNVGLVSCTAFHMNDNKEVTKEIYRKDYPTREAFFEKLIMRNIVSGGSAAVVKKSCFEHVGDFDETLRSAEDWDMWLRINQHYAIRMVEEPLIKIRFGTENMSSVKHADRMLSNELKVLEKQLKLNEDLRSNMRLTKKAFSHRYNRAAWAYWQGRDVPQARKYIWKSFLCSPISYARPSQARTLLRILCGFDGKNQTGENQE